MNQRTLRTPIAWRLLLGLALISLAVHLFCAGLLAWGYMTDELYYLDSIGRLDWGFVDHPPLSVAVLGLVRAVLGDSILAVRFLPAVFGAVAVVLTGLMAREMGGGRAAQGLAALMALTSPMALAVVAFYSMNAIEAVFWPLGMLLLLRLLNGGSRYLWLFLGAVMAAAMLNKVSTLWFGAGVGVGLLLTPARRWLKTPWPWAAAVMALAGLVPFLWWQTQHGWPFVEFSRNAALYKVGDVSVFDFVREQVLAMNPLTAPLWVAGLVYCFASAEGRRYAAVAWIFVTVFLLLVMSHSARTHYLAPAHAFVFAVGGVAAERLGRFRRWVLPAAVTLCVVGGLIEAPLALAVLPPAATDAYQRALGVRPREELEGGGVLPMHLALLLHAEAVVGAVKEVHDALPVEDRRRVEILTGTFGETGAVNVLGRKRGLPASIGMHNQYGLWGPGAATGALMIVVHDDEDQLREWFQACERRRGIDCEYCMDFLRAKSVYVCRAPRRPLTELWPQMRYYR